MSTTGIKSYSTANIQGENSTNETASINARLTIDELEIDAIKQTISGQSYNAGTDTTTIDNNVIINGSLTTTPLLASQTYVNNQISALVASAPSTLDTLNELATALGNDANFSTTVINSLAGKVSLTTDETVFGKKTFTKQLVSSAPGGGYGPTAYFADSSFVNSGYIGIIPYSGSGAFNAFPSTGDGLIYAISNPIDSKSLALTTWSSTTNGIRISPSSVLIGAGGTAQLPTARILCSGSTVSITAPICAISNQASFGDVITFNGANQNLRQINNSIYNFYDLTAVAGGVLKGKLYSTSTNLIFDLEGATIFSVFMTGAVEVFKITKADCTIKTTNNPTITGFTDPIASDSSNKIASTRWVQSAITAGVSTTISTTDTTTQPYYLVGSISQTTSSDTTLYKSNTGVGVYVNPTTNIIFADGLTAKNSNGDYFFYNFETTTSDNFLFANTAHSTASSNKSIFQNINSAGATRTTLTLNGNVGASTFDGLSASSTTVAVADDNTATTMFPVFATTGAGQKSLLFDSTTTPLSYTPSTSTLTASTYGLRTTVASTITASGTTITLQNNNIGGTYNFTVSTSGLPLTILSLNETNSFYRVPFLVSAQSAPSSTNSFSVKNDASQKGVAMLSDSTVGSYNPIIVASDSVIYGVSNVVNTANLILTTWSATTAGVRITPTSALIGAGGIGTTPLSSVSCSGTTVVITGDPEITNRNLVVDAGVNGLTIGNGSSTATSNILLTRTSLASTKNFTTGGNTIIGNVAGNALVVGSANNTFIGNSSGSTATGSNNICIGNSAQVPTVGNSNQIVIGTSAETQFIQGQFNWKVGASITATGTLATPYSQFYTISSLATTTITLQNPSASYIGTHIMFKRRANTQVITFTTVGAGLVMMGFGSVALGATVSMTATQWQCELICDGTSWYQFNMT